MAESTQHRLDRVRKPRVHITYDVETNGAVVVKELPFVVGVMGDYTGNAPGEAAKPLVDRKFISIDRDNFNDVMARLAPGLSMKVDNAITGEGQIQVDLKFRNMDDFSPTQIVEQVEPLKKLLDARNKLRDLLTNVDRAANLEPALEEILQNTEKLKQLQGELGSDKPA